MIAFLRDRGGAVSLEFAIALPVFIMLGLGCVELNCVLLGDTKLRATTQAVAELVASQDQLTSAQLSDICTGGQIMMTPLPGADLSIAVASVTNVAGNGASQDWQNVSCGNASAISNPAATAAPLVPTANDSVVVVVATYRYHSPVSHFLPADWQLTQTAFARPYANQTIIGP